ncbi:MAG: hypothetical protein MPF33_02245 [Candidatus Aramenus sp.]|nr:hypothetical protein [Candidatus Aramenus sp.]
MSSTLVVYLAQAVWSREMFEDGIFASSSEFLSVPATSSMTYDWAVGGYSTVTGLSNYTALWTRGFSGVSDGNYTVAYMLNVPVNVSGYLNVSLVSPYFNYFIPPPVTLPVNWMWIQDGAANLGNGTVVPDVNVWFVPNAPIYYGVIYVIYGGLTLSASSPINETVFYSNGQWVIQLNGVTIATVSNNGVQMKVSGVMVVATDVLGFVWPYTLVSGVSLSIDSFSTETNNVLPSAGVEVHSVNATAFTIENPQFAAPFFFLAGDKAVQVYYANSTSLATDFGFMAGAMPPPSDVYGAYLGGLNVIGTKLGIQALASQLHVSSYRLIQTAREVF